MVNKSTSDSIEEYIKKILTQTGFVEIRRSSLADEFQVVPSQINYVIKTRFTENRGYVVESKRGGGGYIRIAKVSFSDNHHLLRSLTDSIGVTVGQQVFADMIQFLFDEKIISKREGEMILAASCDEVLGQEAPAIRARMLRKLLQRLDRKGH
ncbi:CtsR family transcriptional regulator [Streptococcus cuniculipharyngis]|uniref:Transcriptional regulator CtsR n=1 Tax=Streptococcus cuniculipharyngis TaxID=1562651 RepID=A0A5C5SBP4_9STRE|nr:CtsR family transcriptional regulator [Streptococcus cuniculipharyngis]TWS97394.1 CtsR family transcriptional regulator [Streptococcus cuniculipharyngis]